MKQSLSLVAIALVSGALGVGVAAQGMAHVELKDATGQSVGMAMIMGAPGGGVSISIDFNCAPSIYATVSGLPSPFASAFNCSSFPVVRL